MKKYTFFVLLLLFAGFGLMSCKEDDDKEQTYYVEIGRISKANYNAFCSLYAPGTNYTFDEIKSARSVLRNYQQYDFESNTGYTRSELYSFLTTHGCTSAEAESSLNFLDSVGNVIAFFNYAYSSDYMIWTYGEKE